MAARVFAAVRASLRDERPTWIMLALAYGAWLASLMGSAALTEAGAPLAATLLLIVLGGAATTLHASLQHEALHGHPTRLPALNEALVFPSLNALFPYRRFRELHLRHHRDESLTDPFDDPESWYISEASWRSAHPATATLLRVNATLGGRMLIGPWLSVYGMWRADLRAAAVGGAAAGKLAEAYGRHLAGLVIVFGLAFAIAGLDPLTYLLLVAWPGVALLMLRTYIEHRAAEAVSERTAVVEAEPIFALLFLNNNLHAVHHAHPRAPWFALPRLWRAEAHAVLARNGDYHLPSYGAVVRRWFWRAREPIAHPHLRRGGAADGPIGAVGDRGPTKRPETSETAY